jgi:hypothetical protein
VIDGSEVDKEARLEKLERKSVIVELFQERTFSGIYNTRSRLHILPLCIEIKSKLSSTTSHLNLKMLANLMGYFYPDLKL